jgi:endonuclease/exonuclease/phosphatase family metal-dependent hydrolase
MKRFLFRLALLLFPLLAAADPDSITFCSYNLRNYVRMEHTVKGKKLPDQLKPEREINAIIKFITDIKPDVLGVSEIGQEAELLDLQRRLKEAGLDLPNTEYCHGGDPVRRIAMLTRFPIKERNSQTELKYQMGDEMWPVQRGFLDVVLEPAEGFRLHCVGVHLKSKRKIDEADESVMRQNEAHLLREHLNKILTAHPDEKLLVYGDCNAGRHEDPILDIMGTPKTPTGMQDIRARRDLDALLAG